MQVTFRFHLTIGLLLCNLITPGIGAQSARPDYPSARRVEHADNYHGVTVLDPYRWLEDMDSPDTRAWAKAQDELTSRFLNSSHVRAALRRRLESLWYFDSYSAPVKAGGRYYFTLTASGQSRTVLYAQENATAKPRALLDPSTAFRGADLNVTGFSPDPEGRAIACLLARGQSPWREVRVVGTDGQPRPDQITGLHTLGGNVAWSGDGLGFYYVRFDTAAADDRAVVKNGRVYYHRLGTAQSEDLLIFSRPDKTEWNLSVQITDDGRYLIITARAGSSPASRVFYRSTGSTPSESTELLVGDAAYTFLGSSGKHFYFYTDLDAPRGRIISVDIEHPQRERCKTVIPESDETIAGGSLVGGNAVGFYGNRFVVMYWADAKPMVKIFNLQGRLQHSLSLPVGSSIWGGFTGSGKDRELFYALLSLTEPRTIYRLDLETDRTSVFQKAKVDIRGEYVTREVSYRSKDGTRVPMFVVHKKGLALDGSAPAFMYGYGAFGWNSFLWYQPNISVWLERGGVYAIPRIRGGGEYGESWHKAGTRLNKRNTIDDYLAAAEWLVANRYTAPERLVANGGSASGFLAAAAILERPDLFGAALIDIPVLDMLRYEKFTAGGQWVQEFGSVENAEEFKALYSYSPYHNIKSGRCYPPVMIRMGERDLTAVPLHAYKFTAAMQAAQACDRPVLLKVMWRAGHNFGATPEANIDSSADGLTFLVEALKLDRAVWKGIAKEAKH
jgi:prolyl oligopeptidase